MSGKYGQDQMFLCNSNLMSRPQANFAIIRELLHCASS